MTEETLNWKYKDRGRGTTADTLTVEITAHNRRQNDFEKIREAIREVMDDE
jgi:hypothetical protein